MASTPPSTLMTTVKNAPSTMIETTVCSMVGQNRIASGTPPARLKAAPGRAGPVAPREPACSRLSSHGPPRHESPAQEADERAAAPAQEPQGQHAHDDGRDLRHVVRVEDHVPEATAAGN